jgi:DNA repair photolyase
MRQKICGYITGGTNMLRVISKQHKTNFLTPSGLRCLASLPTVNVSAGCAHNCVYCYTKGYSIYPGDNSIEVYENMAEEIANEIKRKRKKPTAVYFCPSCDPFQLVPEVQQITFDIMKVLLENDIGVQFVTKGSISEEIFDLFKKHSLKITGQIGLISVDEKILNILEPNAANIYQRLKQFEKLVKIGVKMSARCDPMVYGLTDTSEQLQNLFSAVAKTGCKEAAVSFLFLRPAITASLKKNIVDENILNEILNPFSKSIRLPIGIKNSTGTILPMEIRKSAFEKIKKIASNFGVKTHICGCKNRDITEETCYITRRPEDFHVHLF